MHSRRSQTPESTGDRPLAGWHGPLVWVQWAWANIPSASWGLMALQPCLSETHGQDGCAITSPNCFEAK